MKLQPVLKDYLWGGKKLADLFGRNNNGNKIAESWEVSIHADGTSQCEYGKFSDYLANNPNAVDEYNSNFPVLIKYIDAAQNLSVQVHPQDDYARKYENDNGKTEMWYIVQADEGAGIYCGFKEDTDKTDFINKVNDGTVEDLLNFIPVKQGDCFLIEAGTVHAIGAGCVICEVQQNSNVTYRVYDYNRVDANGKKRQLHVEKALNVINFNKYVDVTATGDFEPCNGGKIRKLTQCKYFKCFELILDGEYSFKNTNSFTTLNVLEGKGLVNGDVMDQGDSFFIPCGEPLNVKGVAKIIITVK